MSMKFKEQFTESEKQRLVEIANYCGLGEASQEAGHPNSVSLISLLREVSGNENIGRNPVFGQTGIDRIGGSILQFLLETVVTLANRLLRDDEIIKELKSRLETKRIAARDAAIGIAKACEGVRVRNDLKGCTKILGNLLRQEDALLL